MEVTPPAKTGSDLLKSLESRLLNAKDKLQACDHKVHEARTALDDLVDKSAEAAEEVDDLQKQLDDHIVSMASSRTDQFQSQQQLLIQQQQQQLQLQQQAAARPIFDIKHIIDQVDTSYVEPELKMAFDQIGNILSQALQPPPPPPPPAEVPVERAHVHAEPPWKRGRVAAGQDDAAGDDSTGTTSLPPRRARSVSPVSSYRPQGSRPSGRQDSAPYARAPAPLLPQDRQPG